MGTESSSAACRQLHLDNAIRSLYHDGAGTPRVHAGHGDASRSLSLHYESQCKMTTWRLHLIHLFTKTNESRCLRCDITTSTFPGCSANWQSNGNRPPLCWWKRFFLMLKLLPTSELMMPSDVCCCLDGKSLVIKTKHKSGRERRRRANEPARHQRAAGG